MAYKMNGFSGFGNSPAKQTKDKKTKKGKITGENTGEVKTDYKGLYSLIQEDTDFASKGDTVRLSQLHPDYTPIVGDAGEKYIMAGDYKATKKGKTIKINQPD